MERLFFKDQAIKSSNLESLTYDSDDENLIVKFKGGGEYKYKKVIPEVVENFLKSESKGKFFHTWIKGTYEFEKVINVEKELEEALKKVNAFLDKNLYTEHREVLAIKKEGKDIYVAMADPFGLFIVKPDGSVEDNYEIFKKGE